MRNSMQLWKSQGKTIIISEHRLWYLKDVIDRAIYMEKGCIVNQWTKQEFCALTEDELKAYELRPVSLEERYIHQFSNESISDNKSSVSESSLSASEDGRGILQLSDFYFTYTPRKYWFIKTKLTPADERICDLRIPSLQIHEGSIVGVIGDNGAGKSTFLRCLCGLEKTCIGFIKISGKIYRGRQLTKICYMVMQDVNHQLFTNSVLSEILLSMEHPNKNVAEKILESLDLGEYKEKHPMALSGGQKQRVAIASAMAAKAQILLFDEPTSGLDYRHMCEVAGLLKRLAADGKTIFVSTHDPELIALCCDKIVRITDGRAQEIG